MSNTTTTLGTTDATGTAEQKQIARPLHVLQPLIAKDLKAGREAAERAALPHYQAAGEKLIEAKAQLQHGHFQDWCKRNFKLKPRLAQYYMQLARANADDEKRNALRFSSLKDFIRQTSTPRYGPGPTPSESAQQHQRRMLETEERIAEREAERKLGFTLIDRGYKSLARELHPDKAGGSREAMTRLNRARDRLRSNV